MSVWAEWGVEEGGWVLRYRQKRLVTATEINSFSDRSLMCVIYAKGEDRGGVGRELMREGFTNVPR